MADERLEPNPGPGTDRLDPKVQREIIALAVRLQEADSEIVSVDELQCMAAEAGVQPKYIQEALRILNTPPVTASTPAKAHVLASSVSHLTAWYWVVCVLLTTIIFTVFPIAVHPACTIVLVTLFAGYSRNRLVGAVLGFVMTVFAMASTFKGNSDGFIVFLCFAVLWGVLSAWLTDWGCTIFNRLVRLPYWLAPKDPPRKRSGH